MAWFQGDIRCSGKHSEVGEKILYLRGVLNLEICLYYNKNKYQKNLYSKVKSNSDPQQTLYIKDKS